MKRVIDSVIDSLNGIITGLLAITVVLVAAWLFVVFMRGMFYIITAYNLYVATL